MIAVDGKTRDTRCFSFTGGLKICRYSEMPKADEMAIQHAPSMSSNAEMYLWLPYASIFRRKWHGIGKVAEKVKLTHSGAGAKSVFRAVLGWTQSEYTDGFNPPRKFKRNLFLKGS